MPHNRLSKDQTQNLANNIGAAFLIDDYCEGEFQLTDRFQSELDNFLTAPDTQSDEISDSMQYTLLLLTDPPASVHRFASQIGLDESLTRGDIRHAYHHII